MLRKHKMKMGLWLLLFIGIIGIGSAIDPQDLKVTKTVDIGAGATGLEFWQKADGTSWWKVMPVGTETACATTKPIPSYKIKIQGLTTGDPIPDAYDVVVTEKLPAGFAEWGTLYSVTKTDSSSPVPIPIPPYAAGLTEYYIPPSLDGDVLEIHIPYIAGTELTAGIVVTVNIQMDCSIAGIAPNTLYNSVLVQSRNDPEKSNNYDSASLYIGTPYDRRFATESLEDLLKYQTDLLSSFENVLKLAPNDQSTFEEFLDSFENLLRTQTSLYARFEELLYDSDNIGWNENLDTRLERAVFLKSYEDMLRHEAFLFLSFESTLKSIDPNDTQDPKRSYWAQMSPTSQEKYLASFEDLLKKQVGLYKSFAGLETKLDVVDTSMGDPAWDEAKLGFVSSFEDLLRLEANLLLSFEGLLKSGTFEPLEDLRWVDIHSADSFAFPSSPQSITTVANAPSNVTKEVSVTDNVTETEEAETEEDE